MSRLKKDLGTIQRAIQILAGTYDKDLLSFEVAQVTAVDTANWLCTATLVSGTVQTTYNNVQLTAEKASNGFIQVPKVNSNVILAITWRNEVYVFMCSEVDALVFHQLNSDGTTYEELVINCNSGFNAALPLGIQITDGGGNGIVITSGTGAPSNSSNGIVITNSSSPPSNSSNGILISCSGTMQLNDGSYNGLLIGANVAKKLNALENLVNDLVTKWNYFCTNYVPGSPTFTGLPATLSAQKETGSISPITQESDLENADITHGPSVS